MLKHRQDGLVFIHGLLLTVAVMALFGLLVKGVALSGLISFNPGINWALYSLGVTGAMMWNHYGLRGVAEKLGVLSFAEVFLLTCHQLTRLMTVLFTVTFASKDVEVSRVFLASFVSLTGVVLFLMNTYVPRLLGNFLFRNLKLRTLVLSQGADAEQLAGWLAGRQHLGQLLVGWVSPNGQAGQAESLECLGKFDEIGRILAEHRVNQIIVNRVQFTTAENEWITAKAISLGCRIRYFMDLNESFGEGASALIHNERYAFASHTAEPLDNPINQFMKRALDLAVAIPVVCFVLPPLTFVVWCLQRSQSPGPVFYRQERSGQNRERFHIFKFRTMHVSSQHLKTKQATRGDSRIYAFGRFLRKSSLDEFPQFLNVLLGDMSVSGPRPHLLEHDEQFAAMVGTYYKRHYVKPGITGLAQSSGFRGEVVAHDSLQQRIDHDLQYVNGWSFFLDIKIIFQTARQMVFPPRTAY